ncbi:MAG: TetR/AcrR family transcriptional regulator [Desulfovibrio sp.]|nr:MAG: TetR/AcrR family transcriptional regulator [Desulfovibrio sp.]
MSASKTFFQLDQAKQQAVVDTALSEFSEHGFHQASTNRMAQVLGIAKGSFFKYFGNKEGLFRYVFEHCKDLFSAPLRSIRAQTQGKDFFTRVEQSLLAGLAFIQRHPRVYRLYIKMLHQERFPLRETLLAEVRAASAKYLRSLVREAQANQELRPGLDQDAVVFFLDAVMDRFLLAHTLAFMDADLGLFQADQETTRHHLAQLMAIIRHGLADDGGTPFEETPHA